LAFLKWGNKQMGGGTENRQSEKVIIEFKNCILKLSLTPGQNLRLLFHA